MAGLLAELGVAGRLAVKTLGRRVRSEVESAPDLDLFTRNMENLLARIPDGLVADYCWVDLPARVPPWVASRMVAREGDEFSYFTAGRVYANRLLDIYVNPALQLWCRIGDDGEIFRGTRSSHSFRADTGGTIMFGNYFPNDWADRRGARVQDDSCYQQVSGQIRVLLIRWTGAAAGCLSTIAAGNDGGCQFTTELERIGRGDTSPPGWRYLWHLGPAEIYRHHTSTTGESCIECHTREDVGILQKDVDLPLGPDTTISWRWCVRRLPSTLREDTVPSHDYLSIAVEFDNGRDITYYWSRTLPVGTGYDCPLPNWKGKEFHVVVRSGTGELNQWLTERRNLYQDYRHYMGTPPARIVKVWLIANSIFQREEGLCDYADILMNDQDAAVRVL